MQRACIDATGVLDYSNLHILPSRAMWRHILTLLPNVEGPVGSSNGGSTMKLIDFAARTIAPDQITLAGCDGVVAYVSGSRPGAHFGAKPITRDYADALL